MTEKPAAATEIPAAADGAPRHGERYESLMEVVRGLAFITSNGDAVMISEESFFDLGGGSFLGISYPIWSNIVGFALFGFLHYITWGRLLARRHSEEDDDVDTE